MYGDYVYIGSLSWTQNVLSEINLVNGKNVSRLNIELWDLSIPLVIKAFK